MKNCFRLLLICLFPLSIHAYEGVLEYRISSGDRDWKMICSVKDSHIRAEIHLGTTHFQTILRNEEGLLLLDELNKQVIQADYEREKWGKPGEPQYKVDKEGDYELEGSFDENGLKGEIYSIQYKRRDYRIEMTDQLGSMPGIFLDQFSSMRGLYNDGRILFMEQPGMPVKIYRHKKKDSEPLLELVKRSEETLDPSLFEVGEGYVRAKMRFKMR